MFKYLKKIFLSQFLFILTNLSFGQEVDYKNIHDSLPKVSKLDSHSLQKHRVKLLNYDTTLIVKNIHLYYQDLGECYSLLYAKTMDTSHLATAINYYKISLSHKDKNSKVLYNIALCCFLTQDCRSGSNYLDKYRNTTARKYQKLAIFDTLQKYCQPRRNTIFFEFFGNAITYSLNYDRLYKIKSKSCVAVRAGFHYSDNLLGNEQRIIGFPIAASWLCPISPKNNFIELGLGLTYFHDLFKDINHIEHYFFAVPRIGYRYQRRNGGFFLKIGFTPSINLLVINPDPSKIDYLKLYPVGGIALGFTFK